MRKGMLRYQVQWHTYVEALYSGGRNNSVETLPLPVDWVIWRSHHSSNYYCHSWWETGYSSVVYSRATDIIFLRLTPSTPNCLKCFSK